MKAPLSWLKEYVDIEMPAEELAQKLLGAGFEVEEIIYTGKDIEKVVTGKIIDIKKHFNAEKLSVCMVDVKNKIITIVTGASNIKTGDIVPVALDGATLPDGKKIISSDLRGIMSYGMLCSGKELNIDNAVIEGAEADGILILPPDTEIGEDIKDTLGLNEYILDISITANRADCQSIIGIAREIAAVTGKKLKMPKLNFKESGGDINNYISVDVKEKKLCSRYMARVVTDIKIEPSPKWMRDRLRMVGIRAINNIVDITNYVLTEIGQPMHAFDSQYVKNNSIIVRLADKNEKIAALDGKNYVLREDMLVIADNQNAVGIAGIMGGENSGIQNNTNTVIYEAARFARDSIRHTGRALGLRSASSARFEKGVDVYSVELGMQRALALTFQLKAGKIVKGCIDENYAGKEQKIIKTTADAINKLLGVKIPAREMVKILNTLEIQTELKENTISAKIPLFREDMDNFTDLAEEIIRIYGYEHVEGVLLEHASVTVGGKTAEQKRIDVLKQSMCAVGAYEINTYSFLPEKFFDMLLINDERNVIKIFNPLSEEYAVMRTSMIYNMLSTVYTNLNRKNNDFALFEVGRTYHPRQLPMRELPFERTTLSFGATGKEFSFFTLKAVAEKVGDVFGVKFSYKPSGKGWLHPGISADIIFDGNIIGSFGEVHPVVNNNFSIQQKSYALELVLDELLTREKENVRFKALPKFPSVERDIAIILKEEIPAESVHECISAVSPLISSVELFDVYKGGQIENGYKSLAYSVTLQADRTLQETEINECMTDVLRSLSAAYGARLR